jgi:hypothetical protein
MGAVSVKSLRRLSELVPLPPAFRGDLMQIVRSLISVRFWIIATLALGLAGSAPAAPTDPAMLTLPENGLAYDMMSQIANVLKSNSPENPLPHDFDVERIHHTGQSQQDGSMVTYASAMESWTFRLLALSNLKESHEPNKTPPRTGGWRQP